MLDTIRRLLADSLPMAVASDPPIRPDDIRVAACALLLEIAHADGHFTRDERAVITTTLTTHFGVDERGALEVMAEAERQRATVGDDASFTRQLTLEYDDEQRRLLVDFFWEVARADGWVGAHEEFVVVKLQQFLGVERAPATPHPDPEPIH
jgi:uncharacterized tellurite resistance protein B-like protein